MVIEVISKEKLSRYKEVILPYILEELEAYGQDLDCEYICLAGSAENEEGSLFPVSALIMLMEPDGALSVLSIYTLPEYRRRGFASGLLEKALFIARQLFVFDEGTDEQDIILKAVYRLSPQRLEVFESFLKKNDFTDLYLLDEEEGYKVMAAAAEIRFYKTP